MLKLAAKLVRVLKWLPLLMFLPGIAVASCFIGAQIAEIQGHFIYAGDKVFINGRELSLDEIKQLDESIE